MKYIEGERERAKGMRIVMTITSPEKLKKKVKKFIYVQKCEDGIYPIVLYLSYRLCLAVKKKTKSCISLDSLLS